MGARKETSAHRGKLVLCGDVYYDSLHDALSAASAGDILTLCGDVVLEQALVLDKAVTLTTDGVQARTIRAQNNGAALRVSESCIVQGACAEAPLIIDGCGVKRSAALLHLDGDGICFRHVTVLGGYNDGCGGAVYAAAGSRSRMEHCTLTRNRAALGGAGFVDAGANLSLHRCTITDNHADEHGGAFRLRGKMLPTGCIISGNTVGTPKGKGERMAQLPPFVGKHLGSQDGDGTELAVWQRTETGDSYTTYLEKLTAAGFACIAQNEIDGNHFVTLSDAQQTLTLIDTPALLGGTVRLVIDDGSAPQLDCGSEDAIAAPALALLGTGCPTMQNGASLLFRLTDGRFLVIDGGYTDDAEDLYATMKRLAEGRPLRIAVWVLTHAHSDHLEAFLSFWQQSWAEEVVLENLLVNLPGDEIFAQNIVEAPSNVRWKAKVAECIERIHSAPQIIRAHPGQVLRLGDAELTVLYTTELAAPQELWCFNDTSLVCKLRLGDTDFLLLGDCAVSSGEILTTLYQRTLRCHVLQAAHHGHYNNAPQPALYKAAGAAHTLWCSTRQRYMWNENRNAPANRWLFAQEQSGKMTIWCADSMVRTFDVASGQLIPIAVDGRVRDMQERGDAKMDIKLVGLDLDGTLLDDDRKVRQRTIDALRLASDKGVNLAVISGRNFMAVPEEIRTLPFIRYFVLCNGAGIYDREQDRLLFQADIPLDEALALYDALDEEDVYYDCYLSDGAWTPRSHYDRIDEFVPVESHRSFLKVNRKPFDDFRSALRQRGKSVWKVQSIYKDTATRDREMSRLEKLFPQYTFVTAYSYNLEVNMPAATKGSGLIQLAEILGLEREQVMAFGDGGNDVTMLQSAGVGVAMGNACDEAKAAAACVGPTNNEDGVAQVLEALVCGEDEVRSVCQFR